MNVLVLNCGSSSVKYAVIDPESEQVLAEGKIERLGKELTHETALARALETLKGASVDAVGHRVVHGGSAFHDSVSIDDAVIAEIERCIPLAPLHNPANLIGIRAARNVLPNLPQVAVFDTAFHARLPRRSRTYALDVELADKHGIRRYGFHGPSHAFVAARAAKQLGRAITELRMVTLHLGNGASACAVEFGHSTETSMGMTPLEGLVMGTRSGDIDAGAVFALMKAEGLDADGVNKLLNEKSGLAGLSGAGNDLRDIEKRAAEGDDRARLAIAVFAHRAKKYVGAYAAAMGGIDAIVLTGGIGENSPSMRQRILQRLEFLGLVLDEDANHDCRVSATSPTAVISAAHSGVAALVVKTNEELMIATQTAAVAGAKTQVENPGPIPIAISARHLHLCEATFKKLFGEDATPTKLKDISQPGQYACEETVNVIGPRSRINGVRLLGPLRKADQVEVSRTDEFALGIDAPIRDSGNTTGSAPVILEGPKGSVSLTEGLICARRHIHMSPDDARRYGVKDGDEVEVAVTGGPRDLTFGDVVIRVNPNFRLEMHIDTDEANAAELNRGAQGGLVYEGVEAGSAQLQRRRAAAAE